jgi:hypothetical protein
MIRRIFPPFVQEKGTADKVVCFLTGVRRVTIDLS